MKLKIQGYRLQLVRDRSAAYELELASEEVSCSDHVAKAARAYIGNQPHESIMVFWLNTRNRVIGFHECSRGGVNGAAVTPADIFRAPLAACARAIVLAHNHPSGSCEPSRDDLAMTKQLIEAGSLLGIDVLDHVIVVPDALIHYSMASAGEGGFS